jgi:hypothetical protein
MNSPYFVAIGSLVFVVLALPGCATAPPARTAGLGEIKATAIEVCRPQGQRAYLDRLQCADSGLAPSYRRVGSFGDRSDPPQQLNTEQSAVALDQILTVRPLKPGEPDYHIIDGYEVVCGATKRMIYMDMYHCDKPPPSAVPAGFERRQLGKAAMVK